MHLALFLRPRNYVKLSLLNNSLRESTQRFIAKCPQVLPHGSSLRTLENGSKIVLYRHIDGQLRYREVWELDPSEYPTFYRTYRMIKKGPLAQWDHVELTKDIHLKSGKRHGVCINYRFGYQQYTTFVHGVKHGLSREYHSSQMYNREIPYEHDKIEGCLRTWNGDGSLESETNYHNDKRHGPTTIYWPSTSLKRIRREYLNGNLNGPFAHWNLNGMITMSGEFRNDELSGTFTKYHGDPGETPQYRICFAEHKRASFVAWWPRNAGEENEQNAVLVSGQLRFISDYRSRSWVWQSDCLRKEMTSVQQQLTHYEPTGVWKVYDRDGVLCGTSRDARHWRAEIRGPHLEATFAAACDALKAA